MMSMRDRPGTVSTSTIVRAVAVVIAAALILYLIYLLRRPIGWIFVAGFIAIALMAPVNILCRHMPRPLGIALVYLTLVAAPFLLMALMVPPLLGEAASLVDNLPAYARDVQAFVEGNQTLRRLDADYQIAQNLQQRAEELPAQIDNAAGVLGNVGLGLVNSIFAVVTILILSIFMLVSGPAWARAVIRLQPAQRGERLERTLRAMAGAVGGYVAGAILQALVAGVLAFIVLTLIGMPFALPLAFLVGLFDLIPLVGATIAAVLVGLVTLFVDFPTATIVWAIWSVVYQQVENSVIQPQIQRRAAAVHPFVVLVAVLFGSTLFGILGALLAIPVAASAQIALKEWWSARALASREADIAGATTTTLSARTPDRPAPVAAEPAHVRAERDSG